MKELQVATKASLPMQRNETDGVIFVAGKPYKYKGNCKEGIFYRGSGNVPLGKELKGIIPLNFYSFTGALYKSKDKNAQRGELIFIDNKDVVGSIILQTASLDKFIAMAQDLALYEDKSIFGNVKLDLSMTAKSSVEWGTYYNIEFASTELDAEVQRKMQEFMNGRGAFGLYNQFTVLEYAKQNMRLTIEDLEIQENALAVLERMNIISL